MKALDQKKLERVVMEADLEFWRVIALNYPEIKTGDLCFSLVFKLARAQEEAVETWYDTNK